MSEQAMGSGGADRGAPLTVLVIEEDPQMCTTLACYFAKRGFHVTTVSCVHDAKDRFAQQSSWSLVVSEYHLPDGTGVDMYRWIHERSGSVPVVLLMSGSPLAHTLAPAVDILVKPFSVVELDRRVAPLLCRPGN